MLRSPGFLSSHLAALSVRQKHFLRSQRRERAA
jgi:hypothetical protein